jgi:hypothetical protein
MNDKVYYKVLSIDDEESYGAWLQSRAETYGLDLSLCQCWEDAKQMLSNKNDFLEWDAIILDARCVDKKGSLPDLHFLGPTLNELNGFFVTHGTRVPWYVLTGGGEEDFAFVMEDIKRIPRDEKFWGKMLYFKAKPSDEKGKDDVDYLFENIQRVAPLRTRNKIKLQYCEVFDAMENFLSSDDENVMIEILTALHFPETRKDFDPDKEYSRLRTIFENVFRHANRIGLLPDEFIHNDGRPNLNQASLYMAGKDPNLIPFRYGKEKDYIFPSIIATTVKNFIDATSAGTHLTVHQANLLFGYALQLCDVIVWFCDYAKSHNDKEANLAKKCPILKIEEYEGKEFLLEQDEEENLHCGGCLVSFMNNQDKIGQKVRLSGVMKNTKSGKSRKTREMYPLFAKIVEMVE